MNFEALCNLECAHKEIDFHCSAILSFCIFQYPYNNQYVGFHKHLVHIPQPKQGYSIKQMRPVPEMIKVGVLIGPAGIKVRASAKMCLHVTVTL